MFLEVYIDGSYSKSNPGVTRGGVVIVNGDSHEVSSVRKVMSQKDYFTSMNNVGGELIAAAIGLMDACAICNSNGDDDKHIVTLYYDYKGIQDFATGAWKPSKKGPMVYVGMVQQIMSQFPNIEVKFVKVKAHTGVKYNELADSIAKGVVPGFYSEIEKQLIEI